jgi:S-adenosylmethionine/arginine decarboxylase-like enzyme
MYLLKGSKYKMLYHKQALIKAYVNNAPRESEDELNKWLTELVEAIDMNIVVPARSKYVATEGNEGLTGAVCIETSHIATHIWCNESPMHVELDVYSCKDFDVETVINKLKEWDLVRGYCWLVDRNSDEFSLMEEIKF